MKPETVDRILGLGRAQKRFIQAAVDALLILASFHFAMLLRLESNRFAADPVVWIAFFPVMVLTVFAFYQLHLYRSVMRFITGQAFRAIGIGVLISILALFATMQVFSAPIPHAVPFIYGILLVFATGGARFAARALLRKHRGVRRQPIAIYGAGEAGRQLQNALYHGREYLPVAFIDDDRSLHDTLVGGRQVFAPGDIGKLVDDYGVGSILLAVPSVSRARRREIIETIEPFGLEVKTMPGMSDLVSGRASFSDLRHVTAEDLLGRDPIPPSPELMSRNITGKVVLVTGAGGSIGSELCRQIIGQDPAALILFDASEIALYTISMELRERLAGRQHAVRIEALLGSVQNRGHVRAVMRAFGVQTVYHAAACKHVVMVEENVVEGIRNNVFGTQVMAESAAEFGVESFILVSTDKAVRPANIMGASKRMAELICQALAGTQAKTAFSMVRFGNVLGSSGSVIQRFRSQIERGGPVTVTHREITRFFMTIPEASQLVIQAGAMARGGDVFVLDMGEPVKILDLAESMIRLHGLKPYIMDDTDRPDPARGDIAIRIVGLNKGEKLYEELLIGNDPRGTDHPRILTATEISLSHAELLPLLERLQHACHAFDIGAIRAIFEEAPLAYRPNDATVHDLMWSVVQPEESASIHKFETIARKITPQ